jgi:hypothetical protein
MEATVESDLSVGESERLDALRREVLAPFATTAIAFDAIES